MDLSPSTSKGAKMQYPQDSSLMLKMLNTDCLFTIFSYLNVRELIGIEGVCHRFKEIAEMIYKTYHDLNLDQIFRRAIFEQKDVMKIGQRVGPNVQTFTATEYPFEMIYGNVFKSFHMDCKNLRKITLERFPFHSAIVPDMANAFKNLTEAMLPDCDLMDDILMALLPLNQIEVLSVSYNYHLKGTFLAKLVKIRVIDLSNCSNIDVQMFTDFCVNSPQLQSLNIIYCQSIIKNCLYTIAEKLINLESLSISQGHPSDENVYLILANLPNLKRLELYNLFDREHVRNVNLLGKFLLATSTHNILEYLDISKTIITEAITDDVEAALANLKKLKVLKMIGISHLLTQLSCFNTLQELHTSGSNISVSDLIRVIELFPLIKHIYVPHCAKISEEFDEEHINRILEFVEGRPHVLTIVVYYKWFQQNDFKHLLPLYRPRLKIIYEEKNDLDDSSDFSYEDYSSMDFDFLPLSDSFLYSSSESSES